MISWIIGGILIVYCLINRFFLKEKIEGQPLGMPRGTVRALITILIVSFPFTYLISGQQIPSLIISAIFVLVAFYFESRRTIHEKIKRVVKEIRTPEKIEKQKYPLYLPKYSVRTILVVIIMLISAINYLGLNICFEMTNTLTDLLVIVIVFLIGAFFRSLGIIREKKKYKAQILAMPDHQSKSKYEIIDYLAEQEKSWLAIKGRNFLSIIVLFAAIVALFCYTINWDYIILTLLIFEFSFREILFLLINAYYGFRD